MKAYLIHSFKYLVKLTLLLALLFAAMELTGTSSVESLAEEARTQRTWLLLGTILVLAAAYPSFGFVSRRVEADLDADRDKIDRALDMGDYAPRESTPDSVTYRLTNPFKRAWKLWEDPLTVTRDGNAVVIRGLRTEVVKAEYRLKSMI